LCYHPLAECRCSSSAVKPPFREAGVDSMKLLIATNNWGKIKEYEQLLQGLPLELTLPAAENIVLEVAETGETFAENALLKARAFAESSGLATLADDSGLEVDALGGAPGIYSARYDGNAGTDVSRYTRLLHNLEAVPWENRGARFRCVIALAVPGAPLAQPIGEGKCEGFIARAPAGQHGFGYDPVFFVPQFGASMAQLPPEIKNQISHRARAVQAARTLLVQQFFPGLAGQETDRTPFSKTSEVRIRPVVFADHVSLQRHCYAHESAVIIRERVRWAAIKSHEGALVALVGELDGDVIAYVQLHLKGKIGEISSLIVSEPLRGQGIATAMVRVVREIARDHGLQILIVAVDPQARRVRGFYRGLGFEPYKTVKVPRPGYVSPGLYMKQMLK